MKIENLNKGQIQEIMDYHNLATGRAAIEFLIVNHKKWVENQKLEEEIREFRLIKQLLKK